MMLSVISATGMPNAWQKVTVYDVLPEDCRDSISNNDVGNVPGDMYFNVKDKYLPVACADCMNDPRGCKGASTFDCTNPESMGNLVVRKLEVEIKGDFGTDYQLCDVWDHTKPCDYSCFSHHGGVGSGVGREAVCGGDKDHCNMAPEPSIFSRKPWDYWNYNTAALFGNTGQGFWYSLVAKDEGKYWRNAKAVKIINQQCQTRALDQLVASTGKQCFSACSQPTNQSSSCWVDCFFETVLGPDADKKLKPPGSQAGAMGLDDLAAAWLQGFGSDDPTAGGCPPCPASGPCPDTTANHTATDVLISPARPYPRPHVPRPTAWLS